MHTASKFKGKTTQNKWSGKSRTNTEKNKREKEGVYDLYFRDVSLPNPTKFARTINPIL